MQCQQVFSSVVPDALQPFQSGAFDVQAAFQTGSARRFTDKSLCMNCSLPVIRFPPPATLPVILLTQSTVAVPGFDPALVTPGPGQGFVGRPGRTLVIPVPRPSAAIHAPMPVIVAPAPAISHRTVQLSPGDCHLLLQVGVETGKNRLADARGKAPCPPGLEFRDPAGRPGEAGKNQ